ncbi:MAG: hypothetical protein Q9163_006250 [Psora crenata]
MLRTQPSTNFWTLTSTCSVMIAWRKVLGIDNTRSIFGLIGAGPYNRRWKYTAGIIRGLAICKVAKFKVISRGGSNASVLKQKGYPFLKRHASTIYALSTAPGRAAIAIIRISGPASLEVYQALCPKKPPPKPRHATLRTLYEPGQGTGEAQILDAGALVFYFPKPETATGEDILELHIHGGVAVQKAVLAAISKVTTKDPSQKIRYAEPGEFTKRAFYNNRLDLTQVEALGDTLAAETEQQRRLAIRGSTSILAERYEGWRHKLLHAQGELEALIDFSEDQHFDESPAKLCASVAEQVHELRQQLRASIESACRGELLRNGINIALVGAPNAGKSSLLNQMVGREAAIVSEQAGTTRDIVDVSVDIGGYLCRFGDLAGLRKEHGNASHHLNSIEEEGIRRARARALIADVVIVFLSVQGEEGTYRASSDDVYLGDEVEATLAKLDPKSQKAICVLSKADLFPDRSSIDETCARFSQHPSLQRFLQPLRIPVLPISCKEANNATAETPDPGGVQALVEALTRLFGTMTEAVVPLHNSAAGNNNSTWAESLGATERQRVLLQQCMQDLDSFLSQINRSGDTGEANGGGGMVSCQEDDDIDVVLAAESLRSAATCLAKITGRGEAGDVEEVLGVVFEKFCVGK